MSTATRATEMVVMSSSARDDMKALRRVCMVRARYFSPIAANARVWARSRPNPMSTGSPRTSSRMWSERRCSSDCAAAVSSRVVLPMSTMKSGMSGRVQATVMALMGSKSSRTTHRVAGTAAELTNAVRVLV